MRVSSVLTKDPKVHSKLSQHGTLRCVSVNHFHSTKIYRVVSGSCNVVKYTVDDGVTEFLVLDRVSKNVLLK